LLGVFAALAVLPLVALSVFEYARSAHAVRRLIADQTAPLAERAAKQLGERLEIIDGDLRLVANNEETRRLYDVRDFVMSPDGKWVAYPAVSPNHAAIWRVDFPPFAAGGGRRR